MKPSRIGPGAAFAAASMVLFLLIYFPVLTGQRVLLGGDTLYHFLPWSAEPGAHAPANSIVFDPVLELLPWQQLVQAALTHGRMPLWNSDVQGGVPLLANDAAASFSPFTLLALPFPAAVGMSLAMLVKLLVAGIGMAFYLRTLRAGGLAAAFGAFAYSTSSFLVVWLAWPQSGVAALLPWAFAAVEAHIRDRFRWSVVLLGGVTGFQFLAGNAESSLHFGLALGLYALVRWLGSPRRWQTLLGLGVAVVLGTLMAGIQLVPFIDLLRTAALLSVRGTAGYGFAHIGLGALSSWIFPNALGNPSLDGGIGHYPNFNESTGFVGVAAFVLSPVGAWASWKTNRSVGVALVLMGAISAGIVYGPFTILSGRLPGLGNSNNVRLLMVICLCLVTLGSLGLDWLFGRRVARPDPRLAWSVAVGVLCVAAVAASGIAVMTRGADVDRWLPHVHGYIGFWMLTGLVSLLGAVALAVSALAGADKRVAIGGLCVLALVEGTMFAGPFNPREPLSAVPPPSQSIAWLAAHANGRPVAAVGPNTLVPEAALLYGLHDVRGYEVLNDPRQRLYWSSGDPGYNDSLLIMNFDRPGVAWLAAAGVSYVMLPSDRTIDGTTTVYSGGGVTIAQVPNPRPFAFAADAVVSARDSTQAVRMLAQDPMGPVVVEGCCPVAGHATIEVTRQMPGTTELRVSAPDPVTVVVLQSYAPGWEATIDGRTATIQPADVLYQSVVVPAGTHSVTLDYRPSSATWGAVSSIVGLLGIIVVALLNLVALRRARPA